MDYLKFIKDNALSAALFCGGEAVATSADHGVLPLLRFFRAGKLRGAILADKAIGRAAASLAAEGGAVRVFALVGSDAGAEVLDAAGIPFEFAERVPVIKRPDGQTCLMERITAGSRTPAEAVRRLEAHFAEKGL